MRDELLFCNTTVVDKKKFYPPKKLNIIGICTAPSLPCVFNQLLTTI